MIYDLLASGTYSWDWGITERQSCPSPYFSCRSTNKYVAHLDSSVSVDWYVVWDVCIRVWGSPLTMHVDNTLPDIKPWKPAQNIPQEISTTIRKIINFFFYSLGNDKNFFWWKNEKKMKNKGNGREYPVKYFVRVDQRHFWTCYVGWWTSFATDDVNQWWHDIPFHFFSNVWILFLNVENDLLHRLKFSFSVCVRSGRSIPSWSNKKHETKNKYSNSNEEKKTFLSPTHPRFRSIDVWVCCVSCTPNKKKTKFKQNPMRQFR